MLINLHFHKTVQVYLQFHQSNKKVSPKIMIAIMLLTIGNIFKRSQIIFLLFNLWTSKTEKPRPLTHYLRPVGFRFPNYLYSYYQHFSLIKSTLVLSKPCQTQSCWDVATIRRNLRTATSVILFSFLCPMDCRFVSNKWSVVPRTHCIIQNSISPSLV